MQVDGQLEAVNTETAASIKIAEDANVSAETIAELQINGQRGIGKALQTLKLLKLQTSVLKQLLNYKLRSARV